MRPRLLTTVLTLTLATSSTAVLGPAPARAAHPVQATATAQASSTDPATTTTTTTSMPASVRKQFDDHYGTFPTFYRSGTGSTSIPLPQGKRSGILTVTADRAGKDFEIQEISSTGVHLDSPVWATGPYSGHVAYGTDSWRAPSVLKVIATGHWSLTFRPVAKALPLTSSGRGDEVMLYWGAATSRRFVSKGGDMACLVRETPIALDYETIVASSGGHAECNAIAHLRKGPSVIQVNSGGDWTLR